MVDISNATGTDGAVGHGRPSLDQFCANTFDREIMPGFQRIFDNEIFALFRILNSPSSTVGA
jgi:hypothetical protein